MKRGLGFVFRRANKGIRRDFSHHVPSVAASCQVCVKFGLVRLRLYFPLFVFYVVIKMVKS